MSAARRLRNVDPRTYIFLLLFGYQPQLLLRDLNNYVAHTEQCEAEIIMMTFCTLMRKNLPKLKLRHKCEIPVREIPHSHV